MLRRGSTALAAAALLCLTLFTGVRQVAAAAPEGVALASAATTLTGAEYCATIKVKHKPEVQCVTAGPRGPRGLQGVKGPTGPRGYVGPGGERGLEGKQGKEGKQGVEGQRGPEGPTGPQGAAGVQGQQGQQGQQGATGAQGQQGPEGKSAAIAYATVDAAEVGASASAAGLKAPVQGFTSVHSPSTGVYCLAASAAIEPASLPAVVTGETHYTTAGLVPLVELNASHPSCGSQEFEVETRNASSPAALAAGVSFEIVVP